MARSEEARAPEPNETSELARDHDAIEAFCLSLPGATLSIQWGQERVLKVGGKMFALLRADGRRLSFKCSDVSYEMLIQSPGISPAPYLARAHWVELAEPAALTQQELLGYLRLAHALVVQKLPRSVRRTLS